MAYVPFAGEGRIPGDTRATDLDPGSHEPNSNWLPPSIVVYAIFTLCDPSRSSRLVRT